MEFMATDWTDRLERILDHMAKAQELYLQKYWEQNLRVRVVSVGQDGHRLTFPLDDLRDLYAMARHSFDKWRYFEANVGGRGMSAMIDTERAFALAKTERVLLDEAEIIGLGYSIEVEATRKFTKINERRNVYVKHQLSIEGREAPPSDNVML